MAKREGYKNLKNIILIIIIILAVVFVVYMIFYSSVKIKESKKDSGKLGTEGFFGGEEEGGDEGDIEPSVAYSGGKCLGVVKGGGCRGDFVVVSEEDII